MGEDGFRLTGNLSNTFSALTVSGRHQIDNNLLEEEDVLQQIEEQEQEITQLKRHLAEYEIKEAQIQDEKQILENRIASIHKAFEQQQQDLLEAISKARSYRQEIIEENIRIGYALELAREERSIFISSLVPLLSDQNLRPADLDAYSIVSNLRILFKHNNERLTIAEEKLRDSQYQPRVFHSYTRQLSLKETILQSPETDCTSTNDENVNNVINSHYLPSILEEQEPSSSSHQEVYDSENETENSEFDEYNNNNNDKNKPLPTIEGLQILGEAFPGYEIQASGYSRNGTTHCGFEWVRHLQNGSVNYIEGAKQPIYTVTADDIDNYLAVEVQPLDDNQRKGELVKCFANDNKKITCHPDMLREIEKTLIVGYKKFNLFVWKTAVDTWEPAVLEVKKSGYSIKVNYGPNNGVLVDNKYAQTTIVSLPAEIPLEFSILNPEGVELYLRADNDSDISCSRDTIVLILRLFIKRAVDKKLGKKKRRVLFFK